MSDKEKKPTSSGQEEVGEEKLPNLSSNILSDNSEKVKDYDVELDSYDEKKLASLPIPEVFFDFLVENGINVVVGRAGSGKSLLSFSVVFEIAKTKQDWNIFYIDRDNPDNLPADRGIPFLMEEKAINVDRKRMFYINRVYADWMDNVLKKIGKYEEIYKIRKNKLKRAIKSIACLSPYRQTLVVVDSFESYGDYNDDSFVKESLEEVRNHKNITCLIIHHLNKIGDIKGLTRIEDAVDSIYQVQETVRDDEGNIKQIALKAYKRRYSRLKENITFKFNSLELAETQDVYISDKEKVILRTAIKVLQDSNELPQEELVKKIVEKVNIYKHRVRQVISDYVNKVFKITTTKGNRKVYSLLGVRNKYMEVLYELSQEKQALLDAVKSYELAYGELSCPVKLEVKGKLVEYKTFSTIQNNVFSMSREEAEEILEILSERYYEG